MLKANYKLFTNFVEWAIVTFTVSRCKIKVVEYAYLGGDGDDTDIETEVFCKNEVESFELLGNDGKVLLVIADL